MATVLIGSYALWSVELFKCQDNSEVRPSGLLVFEGQRTFSEFDRAVFLTIGYFDRLRTSLDPHFTAIRKNIPDESSIMTMKHEPEEPDPYFPF